MIQITMLKYNSLRIILSRLTTKRTNPLMADLAARTMIFRGLGSGIVRALRENVVIDFINEDDANQFRVIIWRTNDAKQIAQFRADLYAEDTIHKKGITTDDAKQKRDEYIQKTIQMSLDSIQKGIQKVITEHNQTVT